MERSHLIDEHRASPVCPHKTSHSCSGGHCMSLLLCNRVSIKAEMSLDEERQHWFSPWGRGALNGKEQKRRRHRGGERWRELDVKK